jgi:hypothetical protein
MTSYAVAWREDGDPVRMGKLELNGQAVHLESGTHRDGRMVARHIPYHDLRGAELAPVKQRIANRPTVTLTSAHGAVSLAPAGIGAAREVLRTLRESALGQAD